MSTFPERLALAMEKRNMNQMDLSIASGVPKSAINQYIKGKFKPRQTRTYILAEALSVDPAWLMGYTDDEGLQVTLTSHENHLIERYRNDPAFRQSVDRLMTAPSECVFRAAHSRGGRMAPAMEAMSKDRLRTLEDAPETDEDL